MIDFINHLLYSATIRIIIYFQYTNLPSLSIPSSQFIIIFFAECLAQLSYIYQRYPNDFLILKFAPEHHSMNIRPIDMICFNATCIENRNQRFFYQSDERMMHSHHSEDDYINIHPHNFKRKYTQQSSNLEQIKLSFENAIQKSIGETIDKVADLMRSRLREKVSQVCNRELDEFRASNCHYLLDRVKSHINPEYEIMILNALFLEDREGMRKQVVRKMDKCENQMKNHMSNLQTRFIDQFEKIVKAQPMLGLGDGQFKAEEPTKISIKIESEDIIVENPESKMVEEKQCSSSLAFEMRKKGDEVENNQNHANTSEWGDKMNDIRKYFRTEKTKAIQKAKKGGRLEKIMDLLDSNSSSQHLHIESNSPSLSPTLSSTCIIRNQFDLIQLQTKPSTFHKLIIYCPLPEDDLLRIIKKTSPKEIYINCCCPLSQGFIQALPQPITRQLIRLEQFWQHNQFFDEILNRQYFPIDDYRYIGSVQKMHIPHQHWNLVPILTNVWISNYYDLEQLKVSKKRLREVVSLKVEACRCCNNLNQFAIAETLATFKDIHSLRSLVLKCDLPTPENIRLLRELMQSNRRIECVVLEINGKYIPREILESLAGLPLTQLSINNERNNNWIEVYMDITPIVRIKTLRKLAMANIFFTTREEELSDAPQQEQGSIQLDQRVASKISALSELAFLDLFRCSPIYPSVVAELSPRVKHRLYHLNLSHTLMENSLIPELHTLPQLTELNLDRTPLMLKRLFQELCKRPLLGIRKLSLFHYNGDDLDEVDQCEGVASRVRFSKLKNDEIDKISTCFPNLEYLNIAFCREFTDLPDYKFKNLKYLCSNKEYITPSKVERMRHHRGIEVYLYDGANAAWKVPQRHKK